MITSAELYWFTRLDSLNDVINFFMIGGLIGIPICVFFTAMFCDLDCDEALKWTKILLIFCICSAIVGVIGYVFIPTEKEEAFIVLAPEIANNKGLQQIPKNAIDLLNAKMQQEIKDIDND